MDIERYPQFVPGCTGERLISRRQVADGRTEAISRMTVGKPPLQFSYTNRTLADRPNRRIGVASNDGPLKLLQVLWRFQPDGPLRTEIALTAIYEFRSTLVSCLASGPLASMFSRIIEAFEQRANSLAGAQVRR
jgi:coenzyme Q-binding protein COQ10